MKNCKIESSSVAVVFFLIAVTFATLYSLCLAGFIPLDDPVYVINNIKVRAGLTSDTIYWAFTTSYFGNWSPVVWLSYALDCELYDCSPGGLHAVNILIHTLTSILCFFALRALTFSPFVGFVVAALFAVHPLHVEPVAWIASRKDLLAGFMWMLCLLAYANYVTTKRLIYYMGTVIGFAIGLTAKTSLISFPLILLFLDYWPLERSRKGSSLKSILIEKIPFLMFSGIFVYVTLNAQRGAGALGDTEINPLHKFVSVARAYFAYIERTFFPIDLAILYGEPNTGDIPTSYLAVSLIVAILLVGILLRKSAPFVLTGLLWFFLSLAPYVGVVQIGIQHTADRWAYIPITGLFIVIAGTIEVLSKKNLLKVPALLLAGISVLGCMYLSSQLSRYWRNPVMLFEHAVKVSGGSPIAYKHLGISHLVRRNKEGARKAFEEGLKSSPFSSSNFEQLARILIESGEVKELLSWVEASATISNPDQKAFYERGRILSIVAHYAETRSEYHKHTGRDAAEDSATAFRSALSLSPGSDKTWYELSVVLNEAGEKMSALKAVSKAIELNPQMATYYSAAGVIANDLGKADEALLFHEQAGALDPNDANIEWNIAAVFIGVNRYDEATTHLLKAIEISPDNVKARLLLAQLFIRKNESSLAEIQIDAVLRRYPSHPEAKQLFQFLPRR